MNERVIKVVFDIGNKRIKGLVGAHSPQCDRMEVLSYAETESSGIKRSSVYDVESLSNSIKTVLDELRDDTGLEINSVSISVGGHNIKSSTVFNQIEFEEKTITKEDLERFFKQAAEKVFEDEGHNKYRILYKETYNMKVNNGNIIKDPIGKQGKSLQANVHIVYIDEAEVEQYVEAINMLGVEVSGIYLKPYMANMGTLNGKNTQLGVVLVDIGYESTDVILIKNSKAIYVKSIPVGEYHFISDLHHMLNTSMELAKGIFEEYKKNYVYGTHGTDSKKIRYENLSASVETINKIIKMRTQDISNFVNESINDSGFTGILNELVFTGGGVYVPGIVEIISKDCGYSAKKQPTIQIKGLKEVNSNMSVVVGNFIYETYKDYLEFEEKNKLKTMNSYEDRIQELDEDDDEDEETESGFSKLINFLKNFF